MVGKNGWLYVASEEETSEIAALQFLPHSLTPSGEITKGLFNPFGVAYYPPLRAATPPPHPRRARIRHSNA